MIYLFIDTHHIKLLGLKKTILGQQETHFFEKKHEATLLENGKVVNIDLLASAIKEALNFASSSPIGEKDVFLILPQEPFSFFRAEVPADIAPTAIDSFIRDKARSELALNLDESSCDYFATGEGTQKIITFYAIEHETLMSFQKVLSLIDLKIQAVLPNTLAYFKLFEKTLRREKKENILYVFYDKILLFGYLFDSFGLLNPKQWKFSLTTGVKLEKTLKEKAEDLAGEGNKLNRIILSGVGSESIRQDTFTKAVGVWTNPLKRIIPTFYKEYLKLLVVPPGHTFPLLNFDVCFGAFIFGEENKNFSLLKRGQKISGTGKSFSLPSISLPKREILIFIVSFILSFLLFSFLSNRKPLDLGWLINKVKIQPPSPTPLPTSTPTPTPSFKKEELKIKVLNGSGTAGRASTVKDILKSKGYQEILTGNADNFDYTVTQINVKTDKADAAVILQTDLKDYLTNPKIVTLADKETADVVIIIGSDFK